MGKSSPAFGRAGSDRHPSVCQVLTRLGRMNLPMLVALRNATAFSGHTGTRG
jgi:hypothetical protein